MALTSSLLKYDKSLVITVFSSNHKAFSFGGDGGTSIASQSFLLADRNAKHFGTRQRNILLKNLPLATFFKRKMPS